MKRHGTHVFCIHKFGFDVAETAVLEWCSIEQWRCNIMFAGTRQLVSQTPQQMNTLWLCMHESRGGQHRSSTNMVKMDCRQRCRTIRPRAQLISARSFHDRGAT
jgi:hypothetical protein